MNWMEILAGAVIGVILAELWSYFKVNGKSLLQKSTLSMRKKRVVAIKQEYARIKQYKEDSATLAVELLRIVIVDLSLTVLFFGMVSVAVFAGLTGESETSLFLTNPTYPSIGIAYLITKFRGDLDVLEKVSQFSKYKERTIKKLERNGYFPEDLDKELE
jgi:hypothetical protein